MATDKEFSTNLYCQMMEQYVYPEIENRQKNGSLPKPYSLNRAQIVFFPDSRPTQVRLNDEIQGRAKFKHTEGFKPNKKTSVSIGDIERLESFLIDEGEEADCGHVTMIHLAAGWQIFFDFRYNRKFAAKHLASAKEFLESAKESFSNGRMSPFVDNLFSSCELAAKATLLAYPDPAFREKTTHSAIKSRFNKAAHVGNASMSHSSVFNKLSKLRGSARYLKNELVVSEVECNELLSEVEELIEATEGFYRRGTV